MPTPINYIYVIIRRPSRNDTFFKNSLECPRLFFCGELGYNGDMKEKIYFTNSKGVKLCGILSNSTDDISKPIIILCHGFTTSKNNGTNTQLEIILNEKGISTFRFDFFGHGESEGNFAEITTSEGVDDTLRAIDYLKSLGYSKIGLFGGSFGGITGIMTASKTKDLYLLALKCPISNYKERDLFTRTKEEIEQWKSQGYKIHINGKGLKFKLNYTFFEDYDNNDGYEAAKKINIPTLIVHGDKDKNVPVEQSIKISKILPNCKLEIIEGAGHHFDEPGQFEKTLDLIVNFIVKNS